MGRDESGGAGTVMLAFLVGAVAGAAVALLYAPSTGKDTREYLGDRTREGRERAAALAETMAEKGRQAFSEGREALATAIERGREAYQQTRREQV